MSKFKDRLKDLEVTAERLKNEVGKLQRLSERFKDVSRQYSECLIKCRGKINSVSHIVSAWFYSFLQFKDEVMVLLTGELLGDHHKEYHKGFVHKRENDKTSRLSWKADSLSKLSTDGIDYEWRILNENEKFPDKYQDRLDVIANQSEELIATIDLHSKDIDKLFWEPMKANLTLLGITSISFKLEEKSHNAERINISTSGGNIDISRRAMPKISEADRLSAVADLPDVSLEIHGNEVMGVKKRTNKNRIIDKEEENEEKMKKEKKKRLEDSDFSYDVSVKGFSKEDSDGEGEIQHSKVIEIVPVIIKESIKIKEKSLEELSVELNAELSNKKGHAVNKNNSNDHTNINLNGDLTGDPSVDVKSKNEIDFIPLHGEYFQVTCYIQLHIINQYENVKMDIDNNAVYVMNEERSWWSDYTPKKIQNIPDDPIFLPVEDIIQSVWIDICNHTLINDEKGFRKFLIFPKKLVCIGDHKLQMHIGVESLILPQLGCKKDHPIKLKVECYENEFIQDFLAAIRDFYRGHVLTIDSCELKVNEIIVNKENYFQDIYKIIEKTCFFFENLSGYIINRSTDVSENCNMDVSEKHRFDLFLLDFYKLFLDGPLRGDLFGVFYIAINSAFKAVLKIKSNQELSTPTLMVNVGFMEIEGSLLASLLMHSEQLILTCCNLKSTYLHTAAQIITDVKNLIKNNENISGMETGNMIFGTYVSTDGEVYPIIKEMINIDKNWLLQSLIIKNNRFLLDKKSYLYPLKPTSSSILPNFIPIDNNIKIDKFCGFISIIINPEYFPLLRSVDLSYCTASEREIKQLLEGLFRALTDRYKVTEVPFQTLIIKGNLYDNLNSLSYTDTFFG